MSNEIKSKCWNCPSHLKNDKFWKRQNTMKYHPDKDCSSSDVCFTGQKNALTQETELLESILQEVEHQVNCWQYHFDLSLFLFWSLINFIEVSGECRWKIFKPNVSLDKDGFWGDRTVLRELCLLTLRIINYYLVENFKNMF